MNILSLLVRRLVIAGAFAGMVLGPISAHAFPEKDIHLIVPWKAGGGTDAVGRGFAAALEEVSGVNVVVDNIAGAGSATGTLQASRAKPNGYTVLMNGSTEVTSLLVFRKLPYTLDDFKTVGAFYATPTWAISNSKRGYNTLDDFVAAAKAKPGELTIGVTSMTNVHALMAAAMRAELGIDVRIIPFGGGGPLKKAMMADEVDVGIIHSPVLLAEAKEGMINVLAAANPLTDIAYEPLRGVKTLADYGIGFKASSVRGLFVPKKTPDDVVMKLASLLQEAVKTESFKKFGAKFGFAPVWIDGKTFRRILDQELSTFAKVKKEYLK